MPTPTESANQSCQSPYRQPEATCANSINIPKINKLKTKRRGLEEYANNPIDPKKKNARMC